MPYTPPPLPGAVIARYRVPVGGNETLTGGGAFVNFGTKITDTHNAVTTGAGGAWQFMAPFDGNYQVTGAVGVINLPTNTHFFPRVYIDNTEYFTDGARGGRYQISAAGGLGGFWAMPLAFNVPLLKGQILRINLAWYGPSGNVITDDYNTHIQIYRLPEDLLTLTPVYVRAASTAGTQYFNNAGTLNIIKYEVIEDDALGCITQNVGTVQWQFKAPYDGLYNFSYSARISGSLNNGDTHLSLRKNSGTVEIGTSNVAQYGRSNWGQVAYAGSTTVRLAVNENVNVSLYRANTTTYQTLMTWNNHFTAYRIPGS